MPTEVSDHIATCLVLTKAISKSRTVDEIYEAALDALRSGLGVERASILLFDPDGVMRFKAYRGLSDTYRRAVEGHTPWRPDSPDPQPIWVEDVAADASLASYLPTFAAEGIAAMAFIPLVSLDRVIGKFMLYYAAPTPPSVEVLQLASVIAAQVAFAIERTRTEQQARWNEERLRFALDAASMGTWDWDLATNEVQWSDNLARIHGLPDGCVRRHVRQLRTGDPSGRSRPRVRVDPARAERGRAARRRVPAGRARRHDPVVRRQGPRRIRGRPARPHERRLHDGDAPQGGRTGQAGRGGGIEPPQGRVPGDAVARTAHAAERHPRLGDDAAERRVAGGARAAGRRGHRAQRAAAGAAHRRHPRRLAHHHGQAGDRARTGVGAAAARDGRSPASGPRPTPRASRSQPHIPADLPPSTAIPSGSTRC